MDRKVKRYIGCHNPLTAMLGERAGFDGLWLSGLEVSTSFGIPDSNFIGLTDMVEIADKITDVVNIPVIVDADNGYGDANNVAYAMKKFQKVGLSGMCIEDKKFPKVNSFLDVSQQLEEIDVFANKIAAAKAVKYVEDFMVVARVEALIAGLGINESLKRAVAYSEAGADVVFIHSKKETPDEILDFIDKWDSEIPLLLVPTTYNSLSYDAIKGLRKVEHVIYANHGLRFILNQLPKMYNQILENGTTENIESSLSSIQEVFSVQGLDKLDKQK